MDIIFSVFVPSVLNVIGLLASFYLAGFLGFIGVAHAMKIMGGRVDVNVEHES